jgi:hypothetical protein
MKIKSPKIKQTSMKSFSSAPVKGLSSKEDMPSKIVKKMETNKKKKSIFGR